MRDGSGFAQAVMAKAAVPPEAWAAGEAMGQESSLELTGKVKADSRAPGGYEVDVTGLSVVHATHDYPITPKEHGTAFLMEHRHLWLRSQRQHAVIRIRHAVVKAVRDYPDDSGLHARGHADLHAGCLRGHDDALRRALLRRGHGLPRRRAASSTTRRTRPRTARCTASGRPSAPRSRRRGAT